ncbi:MAG: hypothetical protein M3Y56_11095, partial [Armatimonadota bacterium]|nr:hypothetical protein [Armatimonadota bacterium]
MDLGTNNKRKRGSKQIKPGRSKMTATNKLAVAACGGIGALLLGSGVSTPVRAAAARNTLAIPSPVAVASPVAAANPVAASNTAEAASSLDKLPGEFDLRTGVEVGHGAVRVQFNSHGGGNGYVLTVETGALVLSREMAGKSTRLATAGLEAPASGPDKITIKRRNGRIMVIDGARLAMNVEDTSFTGGSAAVTATGGATATELKEQLIEGLYFADDFMRQPGEAGLWEYDSPNNWNIQTVGIVERGANPFSLESKPNPTAIASSGYAFWSDYVFECAAKGSADTTFGQCVDLQDNKNFYKLQWSAGPKGLLQLLKVVDGKETVLASRPGGFIPGQWYMMGLRTANGRLIAEVDHQRVLNVEDTTFGQGKIGLYSAGANGAIVWFDSVIARPSNLVYDDFGSRDSHKWDVVGGRALGGDPTWQNYTVTAELTPSNTAVGIPIRYQDSKNYYIFTTNPSGSGLYAVVDGQKKELDSSTTG